MKVFNITGSPTAKLHLIHSSVSIIWYITSDLQASNLLRKSGARKNIN